MTNQVVVHQFPCPRGCGVALYPNEEHECALEQRDLAMADAALLEAVAQIVRVTGRPVEPRSRGERTLNRWLREQLSLVGKVPGANR